MHVIVIDLILFLVAQERRWSRRKLAAEQSIVKRSRASDMLQMGNSMSSLTRKLRCSRKLFTAVARNKETNRLWPSTEGNPKSRQPNNENRSRSVGIAIAARDRAKGVAQPRHRFKSVDTKRTETERSGSPAQK